MLTSLLTFVVIDTTRSPELNCTSNFLFATTRDVYMSAQCKAKLHCDEGYAASDTSDKDGIAFLDVCVDFDGSKPHLHFFQGR